MLPVNPRGIIDKIKTNSDVTTYNMLDRSAGEVVTRRGELIDFNDIYHVHSSYELHCYDKNNIGCIAKFPSEKYVTFDKLAKLGLLGSAPYVRYYRGKYVNMDHIRTIKRNIITLKNKVELHISRDSVTSVNKTFKEYKK